MKKMTSILMILALLLGSVGAFAQDAALDAAQMEAANEAQALEGEELQEIYELHGEIVEITEEYVLLDTPDLGHVQANLSEDTVMEGEELKAGQTAVVAYDGMMTRSLPPQITALHIGVYAVSGVITEVLEDSIVIVQDETGMEIVLTLPGSEDLSENEELLEDEALAVNDEGEEALENDEEALPDDEASETDEQELNEDALIAEEGSEEEEQALSVGDAIIAYTTGAMTMSLPPQMNALAIVFAQEETPGEATQAAEEIEAGAQEGESIG